MDTSKEKSTWSNKSLIFSIITAVLSLFVLLILAALFGSIKCIGESGELMAFIVYFFFIAVACFFICRKYPRSAWYVPVLCNATGILSAIIEPNFWITDLWKINMAGWGLSIISAILGTWIGRYRRA